MLPNRQSCTRDIGVHYQQASCASNHSAQAAGPWKVTEHRSHEDVHVPLTTPGFLVMRCILSDDGLIQNYMAEDFGRLRRLCALPLDDNVAVALVQSSSASVRMTLKPNLIPVAAPPFSPAGLDPAVDEQVGSRKQTKLTANDAVFIYQQKHHKTVRMASQLGKVYNVTAKAVRDIWRQRTWGEATRDYLNSGDAAITQNGSLAPPPSPLS